METSLSMAGRGGFDNDGGSGVLSVFFLFLYFFKNVFYINIFSISHFYSFVPLPPGRGRQGPTCK